MALLLLSRTLFFFFFISSSISGIFFFSVGVFVWAGHPNWSVSKGTRHQDL